MTDATARPPHQDVQHDFAHRIESRRTELFWLGIAMCVIGVLAIFFPIITTFTVEIMIGWLLVLAGLIGLGSCFTVEGTAGFFGTLLLSLLYLGLGLYFLTHPGVGVIVLTIVLAAIFLIQGAVQLTYSFELRQRGSWFWLLLSGLVSIAVGLLIAGGLPGTSLVALGLLIGVTFLSTGAAFIVASQMSNSDHAATTAESGRRP